MAMAPADAPAAKSTVLLGTSRESGKARDDEVEAGRRDVEPQARAGLRMQRTRGRGRRMRVGVGVEGVGGTHSKPVEFS
jgi:hypothetical protein